MGAVSSSEKNDGATSSLGVPNSDAHLREIMEAVRDPSRGGFTSSYTTKEVKDG